jgi:GNAT superfamily N-acetyltransferase
MGVRALRPEDVPEVADLHRRVTNAAPRTPEVEGAYRRWFSEAFFADPVSAATEGVDPLVHVDDRGIITGFLGVSARRLRMGGRTFVAALSSQFVVDPEARSQLVAFQILRTLLSGPQDLSIADEANEKSARMWRALGGVSSHLYGSAWIRPLRPLSFVAAVSAHRAPSAALAQRVTSPLLRVLDEALIRLPGPQRPVAPAGLSGEPLTAEALLEVAPRFVERDALVPDHDLASLRWTLSRAPGPGRGAPLECMLVHGENGEPAGMYVTTLPRGGQAQVLHLAASPRAQQPVLHYLVHRALEAGALSLSGRVHPPLMRAVSRVFGFFHTRGPHVLLHARRPELIAAFDRGLATFSRLEGEWCIRFVPPAPNPRHQAAVAVRPRDKARSPAKSGITASLDSGR